MVIGAGIVGVCCAINLQKAGYQVTLIDRKGVAQGCSKGNAGHFATEQVFPLAQSGLLTQLPGMLFKSDGPVSIHLPYLPKALPWFARFLLNMLPRRYRHNTQALKSLNAQAIPAFERLLCDARLEHFLVKNGSLLTFENTKRAEIEKLLQDFRQQGVAVKLLLKDQAKSLEPGLSDKVSSALYFIDVAHTQDPEQLCTSLFSYFTALGGKFVKATIHALRNINNTAKTGVFEKQQSFQHQVEVRTSDGYLQFDQAIVAAGAWSKRLLSPLGYKVPLDTERGYHMMLDDYPQMSRPVASFERKMIMTPMNAGLRLAGTVEFAGLEANSNMKRAEILGIHGCELLQDLKINERADKKCWMGMRPSLPDSLPVIGQAPQHQNIFLAFGHQHLGLTQAAITGELVAQLLKGENTSIDISPFCISRFA